MTIETSGTPTVLAAAKLAPQFDGPLKAHFKLLAPLHSSDPTAFAQVAPAIRAIAGSGDSKVPASLMAQLPALEIISIMGVGYDGVDVAAAQARGVRVTHTPGVLNDDVADLAIGLMLCAARQLPQADRHVREGRWPQGGQPLARKMSGARLGLVGMGRIGQAIARRALAFDMSVAYTARTAKVELPYGFHANAEALAAEVDFLVLITPGGAGTRHLVNARVLQALGKGRGEGILVNVARGSVVDEPALIQALEQGVIAGAGLDVFEHEPEVPQRLRDLSHVVLAPHIGSATVSTRQAMADLALDNLRLHFAGQRPRTLVPELA
jgi:hydroxypyruvate reductase